MASFQGMDWESLIYLAFSFFLFISSKYIYEWITPYDDHLEIGERKNVAVGISMAGYLIGVGTVILGALMGPRTDLISDLYLFLGYSFLGIILLNLARIINDRYLLRHFCNIKELVEDQNFGAGFIEFGSYVASGLIVAGAIHGKGGGVGTALAFYLLSQLSLISFGYVYNKLTPFDLHGEIERDNAAVGIAFGGSLIALGIILLKGTSGDFVSWSYNFMNFSFSLIFSLISLPLLRYLVDKALIPRIRLNEALAKDRNVAVGIIEITVAIVFATIIFFTIDFHISF